MGWGRGQGSDSGGGGWTKGGLPGNLGQAARLILSNADLVRLQSAPSARALPAAARRRHIGRIAGVDVRLVDGLLVGGPSASDQLVDSLRLVTLRLPLLRAVDWWHGLAAATGCRGQRSARASRVRMAATCTLPFFFGGEGTRPKLGGFETLYAPSWARGDAILLKQLNRSQQRGCQRPGPVDNTSKLSCRTTLLLTAASQSLSVGC